nr:hypothetical protein [Spongiactinospora gelatinilytica]
MSSGSRRAIGTAQMSSTAGISRSIFSNTPGEHGQEQLLLGGEQPEQVGVGQAGPAGDGDRRAATQALAGELHEGGLDDLLAPLPSAHPRAPFRRHVR